MNISIYLEQSLANKTQQCAIKMGITRNMIIRKALKAWLMQHDASAWPESVQSFTGIANFPRFESDRDDLLSPREDAFL